MVYYKPQEKKKQHLILIFRLKNRRKIVSEKKIGLVLEGGALRGVFTAGVLDYLMEAEVTFPYVVGVSAGAGNAADFVSGQIGRTLRVITHEDADPYYGLGQLYRSGTLLDLDIMTYEYSYRQIPFDFGTYFSSPTECEFVVANCETGLAEYRGADESEERLLALCKASCSIPLICKPVIIDGNYFLDGSLIDSIPVAHALEKCDKAVVILTRYGDQPPTDYARIRSLLNISYRSRFPKLVDAMLRRKEVYARQMAQLEAYEKEGRAFVIRPESMSISHFENNTEKIGVFYRHGKEVMEKHMNDLRAFLEDRV